MSVKVLDCVNSLKATLQTIPALANKFVFAYSEDDFEDKIKGVKSYPAVAVVYEGMHSLPSEGSARPGISGQLVLSIVLLDQGESIRSTDQSKTNAITLLDTIRSTIIGTRGPTGHFWQFLVESPASVKNGMVYWVSRWAIPVQTRPTNNPQGY